MAKMDEEVRAMRSCVTALDGLDEVEAQARVVAYLFDRYAPQGFGHRFLRLAVEQLMQADEHKTLRSEQAQGIAQALVTHAADHQATKHGRPTTASKTAEPAVDTGNMEHPRYRAMETERAKTTEERMPGDPPNATVPLRYWECRACGGRTPLKLWRPPILDVEHEVGCEYAPDLDNDDDELVEV